MACVRAVRRRGATWLDVRAAGQRAFDDWLRHRMAVTVWETGGCRSWYRDAHGRNTTLWPDTSVAFWRRTKRVRLSDYEFG